MNEDNPFSGIEPAGLWRHFRAITRIPRPSGGEGKIVDYILSWAAERSLESVRDDAGNLHVYVPGSSQRERAPWIVLQSHLDMVCERNLGSPYDAEKGNIHVVREGDWLKAVGTTLGADNGVGVAAMLELAEEPDLPHGPLDLLFTVDEETGLTGAKGLDPSLVRGRMLFNLDSDDDGIVYVGCAGGCDTTIEWSAPREPVPGEFTVMRVSISGLRGGHSGTDIGKNRLNAIRALVRMLQDASRDVPTMLVELEGGDKRNAIPRECHAKVCFPAALAQTFSEEIRGCERTLAVQYQSLENFDVGIEASVVNGVQVFSHEDTQHILHLLRAIPTGVVAMSQDIPGLVETSNNLAKVHTQGNTIGIHTSSRSSTPQAMRDILGTVAAVARLGGAVCGESDGYPSWKPDLSSRLLGLTVQSYRRLYGEAPIATAVHAGLECALIGERLPGIDMVSFGPQIEDAHAPGERVHLPAVKRFWDLLIAVLDDVSSI